MGVSRIFITANGKTLTINQWAKETGISPHTIRGRIREGWPEAMAVTKVAHKRSGRFYKTLSVGEGQTINEHVAIAEKALGRKLPKNAVVHHVDGNINNNENSNLVICPNQSYHALLHARERALLESGDANLRKCFICKKYDSPENMKLNVNRSIMHLECDAKRARQYRAEKRSKSQTQHK